MVTLTSQTEPQDNPGLLIGQTEGKNDNWDYFKLSNQHRSTLIAACYGGGDPNLLGLLFTPKHEQKYPIHCCFCLRDDFRLKRLFFFFQNT
mmetsp:Transcript_26239/g.30084  ORF Transcript_26239/g.30084 Transcript_26239/m.30084 type:complete len:91 (-) Transcript_26239:234-506(-)